MPKVKLFDIDIARQLATELFWQKGYEGTSMQNLVDTIGISRSSIYDTYIDKYNLYLNCLDHYKNSNVARLNEKTRKSDNPLAFITSFFKSICKSTELGLGCFVVNANAEFGASDENISTITTSYYTELEKLFAKVIEDGQVQKQFSKKIIAKDSAKFLVSISNSLQLMARNSQSSKDLNLIAKMAISSIEK